jgi:hypothetical protein
MRQYSETFVTHSIFNLLTIKGFYMFRGGTRWRSWLRHCATNRKVAGSIPNGVNAIFH